jgi:ankyrin repeat protein
MIQGRPEIVKLLLQNGADPFVENVFKTSAFSMAAENAKNKKDTTSIRLITDFGLEQSLSDDLEATMKYVRAPLANVNYQRKAAGRWTPLILATARGNIDYVKELLAMGADPNLAELDGWTALHFAVHGSKLELVRLLMAANADPNIKNIKSHSPLDFVNNTKDPVLFKGLLLKIQDVPAPAAKSSPKADPAKIVLPAFTEPAPDTPPVSATPPPAVPKVAAKVPPKTTATTTTTTAASASTKPPGKTSPQSTKGAASSRTQPPPFREGPRRNRNNAYDFDDQPYFDFVEEEEPAAENSKPQGLLGKIKGFFGI